MTCRCYIKEQEAYWLRQERKASIQAFPDLTGYAPPAEAWHAFDTDTYDADCDENGFFSTSLVGTGATAEAAIADLLEQMEDDPS